MKKVGFHLKKTFDQYYIKKCQNKTIYPMICSFKTIKSIEDTCFDYSSKFMISNNEPEH